MENLTRRSGWAIFFPLLMAATLLPAAEPRWGSLYGCVKYEKEAPEMTDLIQKGSNQVKDAQCCAKEAIPDENLVVDPITRGVANVFVYRKSRPHVIHPELIEPELPVLESQISGCRFVPHAMVVRTSQKLRYTTKDEVAHNVHHFPIKNTTPGFLIAPNIRDQEFKFRISEKTPFQVGCDIHSWMIAYLLVVDHPYAAVTDAEGKFHIEKLPVGEHQFVLWHEKAGYLEKSWSVWITPQKITHDFQYSFDPSTPPKNTHP